MPPATYITTNFASLVHLFNSNVLLIRLIKQNSTRYLLVSESSQSEIRIYLRNFPLDKKVYDIRCLMFSFFLQFYKKGKKQFSVSWNVFLLAFFFVWRFWRENENDCNKRLRFGDTFSPSQRRGFKPLLVVCLA